MFSNHVAAKVRADMEEEIGLRKTPSKPKELQKNGMKYVLEDRIPVLGTIPPKAARIYDGMCIIQQLPTGLETFGDLSESVLKRITSNDSSHIFFVNDQFWKHFIKSCERNNIRANTGSICVNVIRHEQKLPEQMKKYLSAGENKEELAELLLKDWSSNSTRNNKIVNRYLCSKA